MSQLSNEILQKSMVREWIESIAIAAILTSFIMLYVGWTYRVVGVSMQPTLYEGQRLWVDKLSYRVIQPKRGDIIILKEKPEPFVKRIIGLPGDQVEIHGGKVSINGIPVEENFTAEPAYNDYGPVYVPDGSYFVMGDNRNRSDDSRGSVGFLPRDQIIGRAVARYWPVLKLAVFRRPGSYETINRRDSGRTSGLRFPFVKP